MNELAELREELDAKVDLLQTIRDEAKDVGEDGEETFDLKRVECLGTAINAKEGGEKTAAVASVVEDLKGRIAELEEEISTAEAMNGIQQVEDHRKSQRKRPRYSDGASVKADVGRKLSFEQVASRVTGDPTFKRWIQGSRDGRIEVDASWWDAKQQAKTLMSTTAGFPPEVTRTGVVVDIPLRPPQIMDIMPRATTGQNAVAYMQQTTRTQAAAEVPEGGLKPEAAFVFAEVTTAVKEVAVHIPVTDTQLEDVPFIGSLIETMLREDINERLDGQILNGDDSVDTHNLLGILNTAGILTQAKGTDPIADAIHKAATQIMTGAARATPTHVALNPLDWERLRLLRGSDGKYIFGDPQDQIVPRIFGWPVVLNEALTEGTGLIGGFAARNLQLVERRGIAVERGFINDQFIRNQQSIRASMRAALAVYRPAAFATITGLNT